ncbi:hypothetical protein Osc7112_5782 [Oscillatoria nigro-viridis PCC 7112]|uniref:Uncharacterized protein n=1 Tax=Phormidium nigroviride PCC 7112 TaxID=179408 RepID=K9VR62_9CYAN|nr:hypothetical protein Osc7112_5782 [Oscillatoria nigro-viridis PCC 7112]
MVHRQLVDLTSTFLAAKASILKPKLFGKSQKSSRQRLTVSSGKGVVVVPLRVKSTKLKCRQSQICMYFITLLLNIKKADESNPGKTSS